MKEYMTRQELVEHIKKHMYVDIDGIVQKADEPITITYCINFQGNEYRYETYMHLSILNDKAEKLADKVAAGKDEE